MAKKRQPTQAELAAQAEAMEAARIQQVFELVNGSKASFQPRAQVGNPVIQMVRTIVGVQVGCGLLYSRGCIGKYIEKLVYPVID